MSKDKDPKTELKCCQCGRLAFYLVGEEANIPLCLDCYFKFSQIQERQTEGLERMINFYSDQMSAAVGLPPMGPRFPPRPQPIVLAGAKLQNINIKNSVVGTVNLGSIGTVDQSISALIQTGETEVADAIKHLSEAVLQSNDLSRNQINEIIESLSAISKEAATPKGSRQNTVALSLLDKAMKIAATANDITDVCQKWWPVLQAVFMAAAGG